MFFDSIKEINRLRKEINRLLSKGMSNTCLKVSIVKKNVFKTFHKLKTCLLDRFWETPAHTDIFEF